MASAALSIVPQSHPGPTTEVHCRIPEVTVPGVDSYRCGPPGCSYLSMVPYARHWTDTDVTLGAGFRQPCPVVRAFRSRREMDGPTATTCQRTPGIEVALHSCIVGLKSEAATGDVSARETSSRNGTAFRQLITYTSPPRGILLITRAVLCSASLGRKCCLTPLRCCKTATQISA